MTSLVDRRRPTLAGEDMEKGRLLTINTPRTAAELAECQRRRDRYRAAICRWAVRRAQQDRFGFHAGREAVRLICMFGLTAAEDAKIRGRVSTAPVTRGWTRG